LKSSRSRKSPERSSAAIGRGFRVADQIQKDLAVLLMTEVKDPRIGMVTITEVEVSPDYSHAKVFYSVLPDSEEQRQRSAAGLAASRGFLRGRLGRLLQIHQTPELHFVLDDSVARGAALSQLIDHAARLSDLSESGPDSATGQTGSTSPDSLPGSGVQTS